MSIIKLLFLSVLLCTHALSAQTSIKLLTQKKGVSIRGLSIPQATIIWASGSNGFITKSTDGGQHFEWFQVKGYERRDFRSIHAWNEKEAIIAAIASPAVILKTIDGGINWYSVYENKDTAMFLDAIDFKNDKEGLVLGDPINSFIFLLSTSDKGEHWKQMNPQYFKNKLHEGEAFFASSSSNIAQRSNQVFLITGGVKSRLWIDGMAKELPIIQGTSSTGANSIAISPNGNNMIIVGGDFSNPFNESNNIVGLSLFLTISGNRKHLSDKKAFWNFNNKIRNLHGYKSSAAFITNKAIISCGTTGVELSKNSGKEWVLVSTQSYHTVKKIPNQKAVFFAGSDGKIGYYSLK